MTAREDGSYVCDRCGGDCGNGGVYDCLVVSDMKVGEGGVHVLNLHFCRTQHDGNGKRTKGCDDVILSTTNLKSFLETQQKYQRPEKGNPAPSPQ